MLEIVLATHNVHKVREYKEIFKSVAGSRIDLLTLHDFPNYQGPEETGTTFQENAHLKANAAVNALKRWVIADDSGLVVPVLDGKPGVYSARFAGPNASDRDNYMKLLKELQGFSGISRSAYFECCIAFHNPKGVKTSVTGVCEGVISELSKGKNGFGYDPIFIKHDYNQTFAEVEDRIKYLISHRRKAVDKLMLVLESYL